MAFLDNSGDIILDAVLTDAGRKKLSAGNGSFKIVKFALADDEINYGLYDKNNANGSAYYDLDILQTPVEIAHTDSTISLKHKLYSMAGPGGDSKLLYLPELKLNTTSGDPNAALVSSRNSYVVIAEDDAYNTFTTTGSVDLGAGYVDGRSALDSAKSLYFRVAQGMKTSAAGSKDDFLDHLITETQFSIVMDKRYLELVVEDPAGGAAVGAPTVKSNVFTGANNLRVYTVGMGTHPTMFTSRPVISCFAGPSSGRDLKIRVKASSLLQGNENYYFDNFGSDVVNFDSTGDGMSVIDTTVTVIGTTMGAQVSIPVEVVANR